MDELERIQNEIAALQKQAEQMVTQRKTAVIEEIKTKINSFGLTAKDLGLSDKPSNRAGIPVPIKYQFKDQTWTGRGRQPKWVEDYLAEGGYLESIRVK
jgi:DNA-binding protein H-NS